jgi:hypothetical protein
MLDRLSFPSFQIRVFLFPWSSDQVCPKSPVHTYNASTQAPPTTSKLASTNAMLLSVGDDQKGRGRKTYRFVPKNVCDRFMGKERNHYLAVLVFFEVHLPFF